MLRPIDTQTIYQQTQEVANRQQVHNQIEKVQQEQFSHIMQKQTEEKKETVNKLQKSQRVDNDLEKQKNKKDNQKNQKDQKDQNKKSTQQESKIDIKI